MRGWLLAQDFVLNERDQVQLDFMSLDLGYLQDLLVSQHSMLVKQKQQKHLVRGSQELVAFVVGESASNLSVAQVEFPIQHPPIVVLAVVKGSESGHR